MARWSPPSPFATCFRSSARCSMREAGAVRPRHEAPGSNEFRFTETQRSATRALTRPTREPHPGAYEKSIGTESTDEMAVMVDTFKPLFPTRQAVWIENPGYHDSWRELDRGGRTLAISLQQRESGVLQRGVVVHAQELIELRKACKQHFRGLRTARQHG
jgi:hypothetical protein